MKRSVYILFILFSLSACVKENQDFAPESEVQVAVKNEKGELINGATIRIYESADEFHKVINTPGMGYDAPNARKANTLDGKASFTLKSEKPYLVLITYYDSVRKITLSNLGISSYINPLPARTKLYLQMKIQPYEGNILFYTEDQEKLPIHVSISDRNGFNNKMELNSVYAGANSIPGINDDNLLKIQREPGVYSYYANSADGCVWTGVLDLRFGETKTVNITKCENAYITFYTPNVKSEYLPLQVILNEVDTLGQITSLKNSHSCGENTDNTLTVLRSKGLYNYLVKSKNGTCVWTGSFTVNENDCKIIKVEDCEL